MLARRVIVAARLIRRLDNLLEGLYPHLECLPKRKENA
jgi:hypothetical protein